MRNDDLKSVPDEELVFRYDRSGDVSAMQEVVHRHATALEAFCGGWCANETDAQDLAQETWARALRNLRSFKQGSFRAWIIRIARNIAVDASRKHRPELWLDEPSGENSDGSLAIDTIADEQSPSPSEALLDSEEKDLLMQAVHALPEPQRDVVNLRASGFSFQEIASLFSIPLNTALGRMHYAIKALRATLADRETEK